MLSARKTVIVAVSVFVLSVTSVGCQQTAGRSDVWKQERIMTMYLDFATEFPQVSGISASELQQLQAQGKDLILVDVRSPEERAISFIPGSITTAEFEQNLERYRNAQVIAYCTIGYRSGKYAQKMQQQGVKVLNLEGSLLAWSHVQGKLINRGGITQKVHIFGRQWQLTAEDYEPVW